MADTTDTTEPYVPPVEDPNLTPPPIPEPVELPHVPTLDERVELIAGAIDATFADRPFDEVLTAAATGKQRLPASQVKLLIGSCYQAAIAETGVVTAEEFHALLGSAAGPWTLSLTNRTANASPEVGTAIAKGFLEAVAAFKPAA